MKVQELFETAVDRERKPSFKIVKTEEAIRILNKHCKDALWMLSTNRPIWRGMYAPQKFSIVDTTATERRSTNTSNYYTILFDANPANKAYPKRSRSFIASTDKSYASGYGGDRFALIPFDGVPIGEVRRRDMWNTKVTIFERTREIEHLNGVYSELGIKDDGILNFKTFERAFKKNRNSVPMKKALSVFCQSFGISKEKGAKFLSDFIANLNSVYSAENLGFKLSTTATLDRRMDQEVWVGGKCVVIQQDTWNQIVQAYMKGLRNASK